MLINFGENVELSGKVIKFPGILCEHETFVDNLSLNRLSVVEIAFQTTRSNSCSKMIYTAYLL